MNSETVIPAARSRRTASAVAASCATTSSPPSVVTSSRRSGTSVTWQGRTRQAQLALTAGHGLTYRNVVPVARLEGMGELNIGHSIVSRAVLVGFSQAVREMKALL